MSPIGFSGLAKLCRSGRPRLAAECPPEVRVGCAAAGAAVSGNSGLERCDTSEAELTETAEPDLARTVGNEGRAGLVDSAFLTAGDGSAVAGLAGLKIVRSKLLGDLCDFCDFFLSC